MVVHGDDFNHVVHVLRAVEGIKIAQSRHTARNNRADHRRHVCILNQFGVAAFAADSEIDWDSEVKGRVCSRKTAFCNWKMVEISSTS